MKWEDRLLVLWKFSTGIALIGGGIFSILNQPLIESWGMPWWAFPLICMLFTITTPVLFCFVLALMYLITVEPITSIIHRHKN